MCSIKFIVVILSLVLSSQSAPKDDLEVLLIGNSLTYYNNLPLLIEKAASTKGVRLNTTVIALPNYALIDHWNDGVIQKEINSKKFDFVIVQQGPSSQNFGRNILMEYGDKINRLCNNNNARLCFFMVWPSLHYYKTFDKVIANYTEAAHGNNALVCPVGKVWKDHIESGDLSLYSPDGFHPSQKGSQIAAQVIVDTVVKEISKDEKR